MIASMTCPWCGEESHRNGEACPVALHPCCHEMPHAEWCPMADRPNPENNQSPAGALGAKPSNDGGFGGSHEGGNQTEERPAFEVRYRDFPDHDAYRVYASGRIEGFGVASVVVNRIPQLIAEARRDQECRVWSEIKRQLPTGWRGIGREPSRFWLGFGCGTLTVGVLQILLFLQGLWLNPTP